MGPTQKSLSQYIKVVNHLRKQNYTVRFIAGLLNTS